MLKWRINNDQNNRNNARLAPRIILLIFIILLVLIFISTSDAGQEQVFIAHVVVPGDTLWGIAKYYRPDAYPREVIWEIQEASNCTALIRPGDVVLVPVVE